MTVNYRDEWTNGRESRYEIRPEPLKQCPGFAGRTCLAQIPAERALCHFDAKSAAMFRKAA